MSVLRVLGLVALAVSFAAVASESGTATAQVKLPPQIKPGTPPGSIPGIPPGVQPKNPLPGPGIPPGVPPGGKAGIPPGTGSGTPVPPGGAPVQPKKPRDQGKWPKDINGRTVDDCVKEMRTNSDPAVRESAVRTLPLYGPFGRDKGADNLVYALTKDHDLNVRLAALAVTPAVLLGFADVPDQPLADGLTGVMRLLDHESSNVRYEAVLACTAVGPYMKTAQPTVVSKLKFKAQDNGSWHLRRAAVVALANIGQGVPPTAEGSKGLDPDRDVVTALLQVMRSDNCGLVRRAAIEGLIAVGPVSAAQQNEWKRSLDNMFKPGAEKDKINLLWVRVLLIRNSPDGTKGNEAHLNAVADALKSEDVVTRIEGCRALGVLGEDAKTKLQGLLDLIRDVKQPPEVTAAAMIAVTTMKSQDQIIMPVLRNVSLTHLNPDVQKVAQEAMAALQKK